MKKYISIFISIFCLCVISSCTGLQNSDIESAENTADTVKVKLISAGANSTFTIVDDEGDIYKSGSLCNGEGIDINHFKIGTYHLQYQMAGHSMAYRIIEIVQDCTITISTNGVTVK